MQGAIDTAFYGYGRWREFGRKRSKYIGRPQALVAQLGTRPDGCPFRSLALAAELIRHNDEDGAWLEALPDLLAQGAGGFPAALFQRADALRGFIQGSAWGALGRACPKCRG